jgi:deoxyribose-phosphate aldolase
LFKKTAAQIIADNKSKYDTKEHYINMLNLVDYTTLDVTDTEEKVNKMVKAVNEFPKNFPFAKNVAAMCVYPPFASVINNSLTEKNVKIACVSGGFPASQTTLDVKLLETKSCLEDGAEDIDIVLPVGKFFENKINEIGEEIAAIKKTCGTKKLKVILEVDALKTFSNIWNASFLAMEAGADFIKTSTGKVDRDKDAYEGRILIMCEAIKAFNAAHKTKIGIKPAGGIRTAEHALAVYTLIVEFLGPDYINNHLFRIGASGLANALLSKIEGKEIKYFP